MQPVNELYQKYTQVISKACFSAFFATLCFMFSTFSAANTTQTIENMVASGALKVSLSLKEQSKIVPRQQAILEVKLISTHDFAGNMQLDVFDIANAIVAKPFAKTDFKIEVIEGIEHYIQLKEVALYPLKEGQYEVPPITATAFISLAGKEVSGKITSTPYQFTITQAEQLKGEPDYIASSKLDVVREITKQPEEALNIGNAVTIKRGFYADKLHSIMLPELEALQLNGAQIYEKPAEKTDGFHVLSEISQAKLTSSITIIFQEEGLFKLPAKNILWWDTSSQKLKTITLPEMSFQVGDSSNVIIANAPQKAENQTSLSSPKINWWLIIVIITALWFISAIIKVIKRNQLAVSAYYNQRKHYNKLVSNYLNAITQSEYASALACLYQIADIKHNNPAPLKTMVKDAQAQKTLELLFNLACNQHEKSDSISASQAKELIQNIIDKKFATSFFTPAKFDMKLN